MPGTIGTHYLPCGTEVKVLATHNGTIYRLVDNDGLAPFGGRYIVDAITDANTDALKQVLEQEAAGLALPHATEKVA